MASVAEKTSIAETEKLMSAAEFAALPDDGRRLELVAGKVVEMNQPKPLHGRITSRIIRILGRYVDEHDIGWIWNESGMVTESGPDSVRGPDVAFTSYARVPKDQYPADYFQVAPELVFEVFSPDDRWPLMRTKIAEYLDFGVLYVCLLEPELKSMQVHSANRPPIILRAADEFTVPDVLPGFTCRVSQFFD